MAKPTTNEKPPKLLTRVVKGFGRVLGAETESGKAFVALERGLTKVMERVGQSDLFLDFVGRSLSRSFEARAMYTSYQEKMLRAMQMPTAKDVAEMRSELRAVGDRVEAMSCHLELVLEALEERKGRPQ